MARDRGTRTGWVIGVGSLVASGCSGPASTLAPHGPGAERIAGLWWVLLAVAVGIYLVVLVLGALAVRRSRRRPAVEADGSRVGRWMVLGAAGASTLIVVGLVVLTLVTVDALGPRPTAFTIQVISHQWWWEVRYPAHDVETANEIHLPVGRPVRLELTSPDVIHSLWVPALHGKVDHVPGRVNTLTLEAARPGRYRGQCAEYCGLQHAHMALWVIAASPPEFEDWIARQRAPARPPTEPLPQRGAEVFLQFCATCHSVRGTVARGQAGPDLTHVGGRRSLAAGLLDNTPANLARWIAHPQALKPWNRMPTLALDPAAVEAVAAYLASLP